MDLENAKKVFEEYASHFVVKDNKVNVKVKHTRGVMKVAGYIASELHLSEDDVELAKTVEPLEACIDDINVNVKSRHIERLTTGQCTIELGFVLTDISTNFERVSDHCSNIAVCVSQIHSGSFDTHEYLHALKKEEEFESEYKELKKQYQLPTLKA